MTGPTAPGPTADPWTVAIHPTSSDWSPVGAGVLIDNRRVLTCAHVVKSAAADGVWVAFPKAEDAADRRHVTTIVRVGGVPESIADVAVLLLDEPAPPDARPARLRDPAATDLTGRGWWAFGFPHRDPLGSAAHGRVAGALAYGWAHLDTVSRHKVEQGFSGGGLWSPDYGAVVGLVGQAQPGGDTPGDGRAMTMRQIAKWLPELDIDLLTRWTAEASGESALAAWGWQREPLPAASAWNLDRDPEAVRHWRPRARGVGIDSERGYRFRGRAAALTEIVAWLGRTERDGRVLVVTGSPGVGKSAVLGRIVTTADPAIRAAIPADDKSVMAPLGSIACAVHAKGKTALEVAVEIARAASVALPEQVDDLAPAIRAGLGDRPGRDDQFNVVIDALDEATTPTDARVIVAGIVLPLVRTCGQVGVQVIVGSRHRDDEGDLLDAFGTARQVIDLDAPEYFAEDDLFGYALATLQETGDGAAGNAYRRLDVAEPVARRIAALADRNFLIAGLVARAHSLHDDPPARPHDLAFAPSVGAALRLYLDRLPAVGGVAAADVLTVLAFGKTPGLPLVLWQAGLEALGVTVTQLGLVGFLRSAAANFLVETSVEGEDEPCYRLFHQALGDALRAALRDPAAEEQALTRAWIGHGRRVGWSDAPGYLLRSLPGHAGGTGLIDDLLLDDEYLRHADLLRLIANADHATSEAGRQRARLLRLTPHAVAADPELRSAMFNITSLIEGVVPAYPALPSTPYHATWAAVTPRSERNTLTDHRGPVRAVCAIPGPGGRSLLASAAEDATIRLWDPATGQAVRTLTGHTGSVNAVCALPMGGDRHLVASTGDDGTIRLWEPTTGAPVRILGGGPDRLHTLCAVPGEDGRHLLVSSGTDAIINVWDPDTGGLTNQLSSHTGPITAICAVATADGRHLIAAAASDRRIMLWDPAVAERPRQMFAGHTDRINAMHPLRAMNGRHLLATASNDRTIRLWDLDTGRCVQTLDDHTGEVSAIAVFVNTYGRARLVSACRDKMIRVWDPAIGRVLWTVTGHEGWVKGLCTVLTRDGQPLLASAGNDQTVRLWDLQNSFTPRAAIKQFSWVKTCSIMSGPADRHLVASGGGDTTIQIWDPATGQLTRQLTGHTDYVNALCAIPAGDRVSRLASASGDGTVRIWDPVTGEQLHLLTGHSEWVDAICVVPGAGGPDLLVSAGGDDTVRVWDPATGEQTRTLPGHGRSGNALCAFPGDAGQHLLASGGADSTVRFRDLSTGRTVHTLDVQGAAIWALCAVPTTDGGSLLATAGTDRTVRIWDPASGSLLHTLPGHASLRALCVVPIEDGQHLLLSGGDDRCARLWDPVDGRLIQVIDTHYRPWCCVAADGAVLVGLPTGLIALRLGDLSQTWIGAVEAAQR